MTRETSGSSVIRIPTYHRRYLMWTQPLSIALPPCWRSQVAPRFRPEQNAHPQPPDADAADVALDLLRRPGSGDVVAMEETAGLRHPKQCFGPWCPCTGTSMPSRSNMG
jgi:hypothetical protein